MLGGRNGDRGHGFRISPSKKRQRQNVVPVCDDAMECCGSTQLSLPHCKNVAADVQLFEFSAEKQGRIIGAG
jgi:hypothetical protein